MRHRRKAEKINVLHNAARRMRVCPLQQVSSSTHKKPARPTRPNMPVVPYQQRRRNKGRNMSSETIYGMPYLRPFQELPPIEEHPDEHKKESPIQKLRRQQSRVDLLYPQPAQLVRTKSVKDPRFFDLIAYLDKTKTFTTQIWLDMMRYFENSETIELAHVKTYFQNKNLLSDALDNELTQIFWRTKP